MGISGKEIDKLISKLRVKFKEAALEYNNPGWFNIEAFEDRYRIALKSRMNLEAFALAEIANFEKIKEKCEQEKRGRTQEESAFSHQVNKILEENTARIRKYREMKFHPLAELEISHFYGAMHDFSAHYFSVLRLIVQDTDIKKSLHEFEDRLFFLAVSMGKKHPKRIEDHILVLSRVNRKEIEIEKDKNDYLKESAFMLHDIVGFLDSLISMNEEEWKNPLRFDRLFSEGDVKKIIIRIFSGLTGYGAVFKIKEMAENIISDFRLDAFKRSDI